MADTSRPDLCVIGGGATAIELALKARRQGLDVVLVDLPGIEAVDPAQGALRRAAFVASAARAQAIRTARQVGLDNAEPKPNFRAIGEHARALAAAATPSDSAERLAALGINVLAGPASFTDQRSLKCGGRTIRARQFALATGARAVIPPLPGLDAVPYFTPETIADNIRKLSHLVVIGGGPVALELAQAHSRLGAMVTVVPQGGLLPGFEPELVAILVTALREDGLAISDNAEVTAILPRSQGIGIALQTATGEDSLDVSHILVAMDQVPILDADLLDRLKLRRDHLRPDHLQLGPDGQTSNGRVSAIGGAAGEHQPYIASRQASLLVERLSGHGNGRLERQFVPRFVGTEPTLAQVGLSGADKPLRQDQRVLRANLAETDGARAMNQLQGAVRLVVGRSGEIAGAGAVGVGAGEMIAMTALAMSRSLTLDQLSRLALPLTSPAAALVDLANQHLEGRPGTGWARRLPGLGRILR